MKKILLLILITPLILIIVLLLTPSPINSAAWTPSSAPPMTNEYSPNNRLQQSELIASGLVYGPEDVDIDKNGVLYGGTQDGKIVRVHPDGRVEDWVDTGGRPLLFAIG